MPDPKKIAKDYSKELDCPEGQAKIFDKCFPMNQTVFQGTNVTASKKTASESLDQLKSEVYDLLKRFNVIVRTGKGKEVLLDLTQKLGQIEDLTGMAMSTSRDQVERITDALNVVRKAVDVIDRKVGDQ